MRTKAEIAGGFAPREALDSAVGFLLVGIGGAGMSAVARMLAGQGHCVRGTDSTPSALIEQLRALGIEVHVGHSGDAVRTGDAVVLSDAIDLATSPEVARARELGCPLLRRSQLLGWLLRDKRVIAVTGTHGKTTTTGFVASALRAAGGDPTIVVGAEVPQFGGAVVQGSDQWAVVEACEAYDSFHDLDPQVIVLTNLELDHVDFHGDWQTLRDSVVRFVRRLPQDGVLVYCADDPGAAEVAAEANRPTVPYSAPSSPAALALPGGHNALNAEAARRVASVIGLDAERADRGIAEFTGAERRMQELFTSPDLTVIDDYAHHPTEIVASIGALRERYAGRRLVVVYQPHLYSRTAPLVRRFAAALDGADLVVLTDIYPAREAPIPGVSSFRIAEAMAKPVHYVPSRHLLPRKVADLVEPGDVVVGMGAGSIAEFPPEFLREVRGREPGRPTRVAVLHGGDSAEREVSILSGREVVAALTRRGYDAFLFDATEALLDGGSLARLVGPDRPHVCFLAVHGSNSEDGGIQGLLELLHLPYTGSGVQACALAMDKDLTKRILAAAGLPVPRGFSVQPGEDPTAGTAALVAEGVNRFVVKPNAQGSTVGLRFVERAEELPAAVAYALRFDREVLVEEWIVGTEVSVPVLGGTAFPVVEIVPASGRYDFAAKYTPGATEKVCPARLTPAQTATAQAHALAAHRALGCRGCTRTDMIATGDRLVVLEVNTLPGMTSTSIVTRSAGTAGMTFDDLVVRIVEDALAGTPAPSG